MMARGGENKYRRVPMHMSLGCPFFKIVNRRNSENSPKSCHHEQRQDDYDDAERWDEQCRTPCHLSQPQSATPLHSIRRTESIKYPVVLGKYQVPGPSESWSAKFEKWKKEAFTLFREVQSEKICFHSFSRSAKWKKMLSLFFEKWKVKSKCFETEIEKWKFSRIPDNSRETRKPKKTAQTDGLLQ